MEADAYRLKRRKQYMAATILLMIIAFAGLALFMHWGAWSAVIGFGIALAFGVFAFMLRDIK